VALVVPAARSRLARRVPQAPLPVVLPRLHKRTRRRNGHRRPRTLARLDRVAGTRRSKVPATAAHRPAAARAAAVREVSASAAAAAQVVVKGLGAAAVPVADVASIRT